MQPCWRCQKRAAVMHDPMVVWQGNAADTIGVCINCGISRAAVIGAYLEAGTGLRIVDNEWEL